jgi:hypothetical protein
MAPSKTFSTPKRARKPTAKAMAVQEEEKEETSGDEDPGPQLEARLSSQVSSIRSDNGGDEEDEGASGGDASDDEDEQSGKGVPEEEEEDSEEVEVLVPHKRKRAMQRATKSHPYILYTKYQSYQQLF